MSMGLCAEQMALSKIESNMDLSLDYDSSSDSPGNNNTSPDKSDAKPQLSYIALITKAIESSPNGMATLGEICAHICENYSYYKKRFPRWQNSIRHNLSLNDCFMKVARSPSNPGKGNYWQMDPLASNMFENGSFLRRRKRYKRQESVYPYFQHLLYGRSILPITPPHLRVPPHSSYTHMYLPYVTPVRLPRECLTPFQSIPQMNPPSYAFHGYPQISPFQLLPNQPKPIPDMNKRVISLSNPLSAQGCLPADMHEASIRESFCESRGSNDEEASREGTPSEMPLLSPVSAGHLSHDDDDDEELHQDAANGRQEEHPPELLPTTPPPKIQRKAEDLVHISPNLEIKGSTSHPTNNSPNVKSKSFYIESLLDLSKKLS